ncbi:RDD family protein [Lentibacillus sp. N15]|uniref:RDD family protein n=1 Tax=Lentibacillus songyuanensis TaxID=3136161 RepID=UPI0031BB2361
MTEEQADYAVTSDPLVPVRYAGFWMRMWAYVADLIIVFSINGVLLVPFKFVHEGAAISIGYWTLTGIISMIVLYLYFLLMTKFTGQTLGKMIFGLKVVHKGDEPLAWSDVIFREIVGRFLHRVLGVTVLLYIVVAFDDKKQGVHDMIADTYVIHTR